MVEVSKFNRLSSKIVPSKYELTLNPNLKTLKFTGKVTIDLEILEETDLIELHSLDLTLNKIEFKQISKNKDETEVLVKKFDLNKENETVLIYFTRKLQTGSGKLHIEFEGVLNQNLQGFYITKCINRQGVIENAACSQFEPAYARRAFPCFDEPALKSRFDIIIIAEEHKTVLSNMPLKKTEIFDRDQKLSKFFFDTTPIMSTYLVAFVVGDYDYVEGKDENGIQVRIYTPVGKSEMGRFSLDLTIKALPFYTKYFGLEYPLPKLDLIGLGDVEIEAMENWGLITFKESLLLLNSANYTIQSRAEIALVVAHEIAHQWFGNIVTMEWWTDLWLNEGFATYIEYLCVNYCYPSWNIWNYYAADHLLRAFDLDSLKSSHPIEVEVGPPSEVFQIFDSISYCKGSAIIRMIESFIGSECFINGLQSYLKKLKYKNATTNDLWEELNRSSGKDVKSLMQNWTKITGYPVINVNKRLSNEGSTILELKQERFFKNPEENSGNDESVWNIPILITTKSSYPKTFKSVLMDTKSLEVDLGKLDSTDWIKLNSDNLGFYRVNYSKKYFEELIAHLDDADKLGSTLDRFGLVSDAFAMVKLDDINSNNPMAT